jgi:transcription factor MYB, plant
MKIFDSCIFCYSNRTGNAVKNRFSTLCKRRANDDDSCPENGTPCSNANAKRVLTQIGCLTPGEAQSSLSIKQIRYTEYQKLKELVMYAKQSMCIHV